MTSIVSAILALFFQVDTVPQGSVKSLRPLRCLDDIDNQLQSKGRLLLLWGRGAGKRVESFAIYDDGLVSFDIQTRTHGIKDCHAELTPESVAKVKADLGRTKVCRIRVRKSWSGKVDVGAHIDLGPTFKCHIKMSPERWDRTPETRALQAVIDGVRRDLCGGLCPEPNKPDVRPEPDEDLIRMAKPPVVPSPKKP